MKLTLAEPKLLKDSISIISDLVSEVRFSISADAIELVAMDPANVAMVIFKLLSSCFAEYEVKDAKGIAINLNDLKQVLRRVKPDDTLTIEQKDGKIVLTAKSAKGGSTRKFSLALIDLEEREQKVPSLEFKAKVSLAAERLNEAVEDADIVGESVSFAAEQKKLLISAAGDLRKADVEIAADKQTTIEASEKVKSKFSTEYLKKMIQGSKLADSVTLRLGENYPIKIEYTLVDKLQLAFILAPRVDND